MTKELSDEGINALRANVRQELDRNPFVSCLLSVLHDPPQRLVRAEHILGLRDLAAAEILYAPFNSSKDITRDQENATRFFLHGLFKVATPVLWETEIYEAAKGLKFPTGSTVKTDDLPRVSFWTWSEPLFVDADDGCVFKHLGMFLFRLQVDPLGGFTSDTGDGRRAITVAQLLKHDDWHGQHGPPNTCFNMATIWEDTELSETEDWPEVFSCAAFLRSEHVPKESISPPRPMWRRSADKKRPEVTFVSLRRAARESKEAGGGEHVGREGREYHFQWLVSGHLRNQWYPSSKDHRLIYVPPYVKGPADKPLKRSVYHAVR